jgi:6-pyruvoyltetrahydropterin/6-carboxytetrahydropterin synthase
MIIRKQFKFCGGHYVRQSSFSEKCSMSNHGHNFEIEVFLKSDTLDNAGMVVDFGFIKNLLNDFIDSFDHCTYMWNKERQEIKDFFKKYSKRWIELPFTPSAELLSVMFLYTLDQIIKNTKFSNGEMGVESFSVIVHETDSGYAQAFKEDLHLVNYKLHDIIFSDDIINTWKNKYWRSDIDNNTKFEGPKSIQYFDEDGNLTNDIF